MRSASAISASCLRRTLVSPPRKKNLKRPWRKKSYSGPEKSSLSLSMSLSLSHTSLLEDSWMKLLMLCRTPRRVAPSWTMTSPICTWSCGSLDGSLMGTTSHVVILAEAVLERLSRVSSMAPVEKCSWNLSTVTGLFVPNTWRTTSSAGCTAVRSPAEPFAAELLLNSKLSASQKLSISTSRWSLKCVSQKRRPCGFSMTALGRLAKVASDSDATSMSRCSFSRFSVASSSRSQSRALPPCMKAQQHPPCAFAACSSAETTRLPRLFSSLLMCPSVTVLVSSRRQEPTAPLIWLIVAVHLSASAPRLRAARTRSCASLHADFTICARHARMLRIQGRDCRTGSGYT